MTAYLQWVARQLYLLYFWPTRFKNEHDVLDRERRLDNAKVCLCNLLRMLPATLLLASMANLIPGCFFDSTIGHYHWGKSWSGVTLGVAGGVALGMAGGVVGGVGWDLAFGVAFGVAFGLAGGVAFGLADGMAFGVAFGVAGGVALGLAGGMAFGVPFGVAGGAASGLTWGRLVFCVALGLVYGVGGGVGFRVAFGVEWLGMALGMAFVVVSGLAIAETRSLALDQPRAVAFGVAGGMVGGWAFGPTQGAASGWAFGVAFTVGWCRLLDYPLYALLALIFTQRQNKDPAQLRRAWSRHPLAWNEVIWLPVPRAGKFLSRLAQADRDFGFEKIAFVAAERPLQRRAAKAALIEVTLDDLGADSLRKLVDLPARLQWTRGLSVDLPVEVREGIPVFVRIAEIAAQRQALQSRFRQKEALQRAQKELDDLRKQLISGSGKLNPRLLQRANAWAAVLETELCRIVALAKAEGEIPQVFRFGNPLREDEAFVFAGRKDVVAELESVLLADTHPPAILLHGPRRMGKSSILCQLPLLLGPDFAPANLDCQNPAVRSGAAHLFAAITRELSTALERRRVHIEPLERAALQTDAFGVFDDWLRATEKAMPSRVRAVLCFDEYEALDEALAAGWGRPLLDYLRHLQQHRPKVVLIFSGMRTFHALGREWTSRFVSTRSTRVSFLRPEELRPMLEKPVPEFNLHYTEGSLNLLLELTHGQPFLTQTVAKELVDLMNDERRHDATLADVERAAQKAMRSGEEYFFNVWDDAESDGQALLTAILGGAAAPAGPTRARLREMDVLDDQGKFAVPLFERWVRKNLAQH